MSTITIAISGPSSSGKTTLSRLLKHLLESTTPPVPTTILHVDDFYLSDSQIPYVVIPSTGERLQDWDCPESVDFPAFERTLGHVETHGTFPEEFESLEVGNSVGSELDRVLGTETVAALQKRLEEEKASLEGVRRVVITDGFLLLGRSVPASIKARFGVKILLRADYDKAKQRREGREGYVTLEGFWKDPEGYFEKVVWPGFVKEHADMFEGGDVQGGELTEEFKAEGVMLQPRGYTMEEVVGWAVEGILRKFDAMKEA